MHRQKPTILVIERESDDAAALIAFLRAHELEPLWARDAAATLAALDGGPIDAVVADPQIAGVDATALLERARRLNPEVCVVITTSDPAGADAVEAIRQGAYDVQEKPPNLEKLLAVLRRGLAHQALVARFAEIETRLDEHLGLERLGGHSRAIQRVVDQVRAITQTRATVLIEGEIGTGKGVLAEAIHHHSPRKTESFVAINLGAVAGDAIERELFGHQSGPGGAGVERGCVERADGGTLFLDEIGESPPEVQVELLRVLQDRAFERVGGSEPLEADVRLIGATHRDLAAEVKAGRFREDLFYRLSVVRIHMPALRDRREDIPVLVDAFIREFNRQHARKVTGLSRGALDRLTRYSWPGNLRELRNTIEGMVVFAEGKRPLDLSDLPDALREIESAGEKLEVSVGMSVDEAERQLIVATLRHTGQDKTRAAAMLGIGLRTLYRKIKQYSIQ